MSWFLDQRFYNQLPLIQTIRDLKIAKCKQELNFDFLYELVNLTSLDLRDHPIPVRTLHKKLKKHKCFGFFDSLLPEKRGFGFRRNQINFIEINRYFCLLSDPISSDPKKVTKIAIDELVSTLEAEESIKKFLV